MKHWSTEGGVWLGEIQPHEVMQHLHKFIEYDHEIGRLKWINDYASYNLLPASMKRKVRMGQVIKSTRPGRQYEVTIGGRLRDALPIVWEYCTGVKRRVMTIEPDETVFRIDNLCLLPQGNSRAPKDRAKRKRVVSWSYARKQFTVVDVDVDYNRDILSYHDDIDDAIKASRKQTVSFL